MDSAAQTSICPQCGSGTTGSLFCKNCGATLRQITSLVHQTRPTSSTPTVNILKRIFRGIVTTIAVLAGVVFIFDKPVSDVAEIALVASGVVLVLCLLVWRIFDLGDDDWFQPKKKLVDQLLRGMTSDNACVC